MGVLSDKDIFDALDKGTLSIDPLTTNNVQPASIDLTLHHIVEVVTGSEPLDVSSETKESLKHRSCDVDITNGYSLSPGAFVTGYSEEKIRLTSFLCGRTFNRNSLARYGVDVTASAYMNPGFHGRKIIVIRNFGPTPIILRPLMRICQLQIISLQSDTQRSYDDRHDFDKIYEIAKNNSKVNTFNNSTETIDNPLSKFMDEQIRAAAARI